MRIIDWLSDGCSSDLLACNEYSRCLAVALLPIVIVYPLCKRFTYWPQVVLGIGFNWGMLMAWSDTQNIVPAGAIAMWVGAVLWQVGYDSIRSEEHTSELQSLMRISYAVFCFKKKNKNR